MVLAGLPADDQGSDHSDNEEIDNPENNDCPEDDSEDSDLLIDCVLNDDWKIKDPFTAVRVYMKSFDLTCHQGDGLLRYLQAEHPEYGYPRSWRGLFNTPRTPIQTRVVSPGSYFHFGIQNALNAYDPLVFEGMKELEADFGCDGFQTSKSSSTCGWPILCAIVNTKLNPGLVGMYTGPAEPDDFDVYLQEFSEELQDLKSNGVRLGINGPIVPFKVRCFTGDTPARSKMMGVMSHSAKKGCQKCEQESYHIGYWNYFQPTSGKLRTNESHAHREDPEYHKKSFRTALELAGIGMVDQFPVECMHLVDLGVSKTILTAITHKKCLGASKIDVEAMGKAYAKYKKHTPKEFARVPRDLKYLAKFKATELRQFLLYGGVVLLKEYLPKEAYTHFLRLSLGYRIVNDSNLAESLDVAQMFFEDFVAEYTTFYPDSGLPHNVHVLLHIVADVKRYGPVQGYSAYKYENSIRLLGKYIKKKSQILQQIYNRMQENQKVDIPSTSGVHKPTIKKGDTFILKDSLNYVDICEVNGSEIIVREYAPTTDFFVSPIPSKHFHIGLTKSYKGEILLPAKIMKSSDMWKKCYKVPYYDDFVIIPLVE